MFFPGCLPKGGKDFLDVRGRHPVWCSRIDDRERIIQLVYRRPHIDLILLDRVRDVRVYSDRVVNGAYMIRSLGKHKIGRSKQLSAFVRALFCLALRFDLTYAFQLHEITVDDVPRGAGYITGIDLPRIVVDSSNNF